MRHLPLPEPVVDCGKDLFGRAGPMPERGCTIPATDIKSPRPSGYFNPRVRHRPAMPVPCRPHSCHKVPLFGRHLERSLDWGEGAQWHRGTTANDKNSTLQPDSAEQSHLCHTIVRPVADEYLNWIGSLRVRIHASVRNSRADKHRKPIDAVSLRDEHFPEQDTQQRAAARRVVRAGGECVSGLPERLASPREGPDWSQPEPFTPPPGRRVLVPRAHADAAATLASAAQAP
jgi:hypothetical protein